MMNEGLHKKGSYESYEKWLLIAAWIFFIAAIIFHLTLLARINDQGLRGMFYDAMNTPDPPPRQDFNALYTQAGNLIAGKSIYPTVEELTLTGSSRKDSYPRNEIRGLHSSLKWDSVEVSASDATPAAEEGPTQIVQKIRAALPPFRYLPAAALVGLPFTLLPFANAYIAWIIFHEILIILALYLLYRSTPDKNLGLILCGMLLFFAPYYLEIFQGQFSWPQAFLMLLALYQLECGGEKWALWAFIASILWKLNTILWVIPIAFVGRWRWLIYLVIAILIGSIPYFIIHPDDLKIFIGINFRPDLTHSYHFGNSGLRMLIDVLLRRAEYTTGGALPDPLVKYLSPLIAPLLFGFTTWITWRRRDDFVGCLLIFGTLFFLIYTDIWVHHWMMILPIVIWEYRRTRSPFVLIIWIILALPTRFDWIGNFNELRPFFPTPEQVPNFPAALLYFSQKSIPALALWIWQFRRMLRS